MRIDYEVSGGGLYNNRLKLRWQVCILSSINRSDIQPRRDMTASPNRLVRPNAVLCRVVGRMLPDLLREKGRTGEQDGRCPPLGLVFSGNLIGDGNENETEMGRLIANTNSDLTFYAHFKSPRLIQKVQIVLAISPIAKYEKFMLENVDVQRFTCDP